MIHSTAIISPEAQIADDVEVGPYAIIEGAVKLSAGVRVLAHAQLLGDVEVGEGTLVGRGAIIGEEPQDFSFDPAAASGIRIGRKNRIREYCTIHRGSKEGTMTVIGDDNFLMGGVHLAHDVRLGNENVIANNCLLGGHVQVGEKVFLGGGAVFHQQIRLGDGCIVQGNGAISKDIPPYCVAAKLNELHGLNVIGLRRAGADGDARKELKRAYSLVFRGDQPFGEVLAKLDAESWGPLAANFFDFLRAESKKGICFPST
ncbi:MAG: acyl-ACP--UDP-N-acetylglucosamine O-acyltransferase, partial [Verrucomicrobiota bacterium]